MAPVLRHLRFFSPIQGGVAQTNPALFFPRFGSLRLRRGVFVVVCFGFLFPGTLLSCVPTEEFLALVLVSGEG